MAMHTYAAAMAGGIAGVMVALPKLVRGLSLAAPVAVVLLRPSRLIHHITHDYSCIS